MWFCSKSGLSPTPADAISEVARRALPGAKLIVVTPRAGEQETVDYLRRGVRGILARAVSPDLLVRCVRKVAAGETWLDKQGVNWVIEAYRTQALQGTAPKQQLRLSEKEMLIISGVTQGMKNKDIAREVGTTEQVVKNYLRKIYDKLQVADRLELALYSMHHRLLDGYIVPGGGECRSCCRWARQGELRMPPLRPESEAAPPSRKKNQITIPSTLRLRAWSPASRRASLCPRLFPQCRCGSVIGSYPLLSRLAMRLSHPVLPKHFLVYASAFLIRRCGIVECADASQPLRRSCAAVLTTSPTAYWQTTGVPSASIAVVQNGKIAYVQAYGNARLDPNTAASSAMRYSIGSISKQFTAAAILLLAEEGKLSLDDPVSKYVPGLTRGDEVTIRELLSHTSGYQDYWPQDYVPPLMLQPISADGIMDRWARKPLDFDPGTKWQYSNTNYVIAGVIVEKVSRHAAVAVPEPACFHSAGE